MRREVGTDEIEAYEADVETDEEDLALATADNTKSLIEAVEYFNKASEEKREQFITNYKM
jgi:ParB-like chromosome segregation protein Spo0J